MGSVSQLVPVFRMNQSKDVSYKTGKECLMCNDPAYIVVTLSQSTHMKGEGGGYPPGLVFRGTRASIAPVVSPPLEGGQMEFRTIKINWYMCTYCMARQFGNFNLAEWSPIPVGGFN